jgi:hypothetical protein
MPLLEVLTVQVGPAVANAILKYWLKDPNLFNATATGVGSGLIDVFKRKTSDVFAQRQGAIQFDQISLKMAEHLHRIIRAGRGTHRRGRT